MTAEGDDGDAEEEGGGVMLEVCGSWLTEERLLTLPAGLCGVAAVMQYLGVTEARVSDADLLDGLLASVMQAQPDRS